MAKKQTKYSSIHKKLEVKVEKEKDDLLASFTHYLHTHTNGVSHHFKEGAAEYLTRKADDLSLAKESDFQYFLPVKFDVPFPPPKNPAFSFIDLFAGIGGFRIAFQKQGGKCVFSSEWDKYAKKTYNANFGEVPFGDITKIDEDNIPKHDILLAGFPCQPFSIAGVSKKNSLGKKHGFLDETQGTLFYDIVRILKKRRPKAFLLENVKNLRSHDKGKTYKVIKEALKELDYITFDQVIDAKHYVPQHRERIFIAGFNKDYFKESINFEFPEYPDKQPRFRDILLKKVNKKYILTDHLWKYLQDYAEKHRKKGNGFGFGMTDMDGVSRTLSARYYKDGSEVLIPRGKGKNPRRLSPEECKRLMGYPDDFNIKNIGISDTQLYKQFGNSVVVPVVTAVAEQMMQFIENNIQEKAQSSVHEEAEVSS